MNWKKLGKIFDPAEHPLLPNCFGFAQSPQALVFDDFVRIYYSTREKDASRKYLSQVSFVDFTKDFSKVLRVADKPVIPLGKLGCFDEHGIFPFNILRKDDKILAYSTGWTRKVSVSADGSIGFAESTDGGLSFQKFGDGPVLTSSLHEPFLVGDGFVKIIDNKFHMWYIYGNRWIENPEDRTPERVYKIAHATSPDGIVWNRNGNTIIADKLNENECQALPSVIQHNGKYHMVFCYRDAFGFRTNREKAYRIGYAHSNDLTTWTREDESLGIEPAKEGWDSDMMCYPNIFKSDERVYMLYNGNEFGREGFGLAVLEE